MASCYGVPCLRASACHWEPAESILASAQALMWHTPKSPPCECEGPARHSKCVMSRSRTCACRRKCCPRIESCAASSCSHLRERKHHRRGSTGQDCAYSFPESYSLWFLRVPRQQLLLTVSFLALHTRSKCGVRTVVLLIRLRSLEHLRFTS